MATKARTPEQNWRRKREETLLDLANLTDTGTDRYLQNVVHRYYWVRSLRSSLEKYRGDLRKIWAGDYESTESIIRRWIEEAEEEPSWFVGWGIDDGHRYWTVSPNYAIFPLALALGVSELHPRMAVCRNPECPNRYFLKARKTQQFCDRPACTTFGQREHKRKWWREHGEQWKEKRHKKLVSKSKKHGGR